MVNAVNQSKAFLVMAGLLVLCLSLSSCDTLKQKFIRHKKTDNEDQNFVPVLEPEEYPSPAQNPELNYKEHYSLIKAWYVDLWSGVYNKGASHYTQYVLKQVGSHILKMEDLVDDPTKIYLQKLSTYLDYYKASLDQMEQMRNYSRIQSDLRAFDRLLRDHLRDDKLKGHFVKVMPPS